ncbi:late embryogenesis abundant protein D-34-like [Rhododendron vialii]|uniref:late embryogenesis abundant protein D-34-like n=1 Tax=Rhododendron vialii TaxID=182163 RepID=UPI00265D67B4|nr:late embryogenesis abundant protein D-34-like [Rhododendron vialii]
MSQQQPRRPQETQRRQQEPIKYGDVFQVSGDLAGQPITPQDAAMMQTAEASVFGQVPSGGPAAVMQAAAAMNERAGVVGRDDATDVARDRGVAVSATDTEYPGTWVVTESVGGQVLGQVYQYTEVQATTAGAAVVQAQITIGEALEAAIATAGNKPVDQSDAAAVQAAEVRATGSNVIAPGGVGATAQSAAAFNAGLDRDEDKIKLVDVLTGATARLPADKVATRDDAEGVVTAELRNNPNLTTNPGGVATSMTAAARLNEGATST